MVVKKVVILGLPRTGKSTFTKLLCGENPPVTYSPTIGLEIDSARISENLEIVTWDVGGLSQFQSLWHHFISGASVIFVMTDSTYENVIQTKKIISQLRKYTPKSKVICIANKQDLPGAMKKEEIEAILGVKVVDFVAVDRSQRAKGVFILKNALGEVERFS